MTEKRKRRRFQFSLRSLLVFVLLVSICMSWLGVKMERARKQREAVEVIEEAGGAVTYDYEMASPVSSVPIWMRELLGEDFFFDVLEVRAIGADLDNAGLEPLKELTGLQMLYLNGTKVTGAGLEHLNGLANLQWLDLNGTKVTDAGLEHLKGLTNLEELDLSDTQVTAQGVESLRQALPNCIIDSYSVP